MNSGLYDLKGITLSRDFKKIPFGDFSYDSDSWVIKGDLEDVDGASAIMGILQPKIGDLAFVRKYLEGERNGLIELYSLHNLEGALWFGEFYADKAALLGEVKCEIHEKKSPGWKDWRTQMVVDKMNVLDVGGLTRRILTRNQEVGLIKIVSGLKFDVNQHVLDFYKETEDAFAAERARNEASWKVEEETNKV